MNARTSIVAGRAAAALTLTLSMSLALAAPSDIDAPGRSADTSVPHGAPSSKPATATTASPSPGDVGDADSFGRSLQWLGLADGDVDLAADCTGDTFPCTVLAPPPASTSFSYSDLGHITLPARAAHSLLCYWFSPFLTIGYGNDGAAPVVAHLNYTPTVTIENPMLDDPSLIDPTTGLPFNGSLLTGMTSSETFETPLDPGVHVTERTRDSAVCIAGLISKSTLMSTYGFTDAQARDFFRQQMTLRLNIDGTAQYVDFAALYFGWRIVGD
ncbi:MAG TPA: hypothetical protein VFV97_12635 [Rhodanobacteraceae bacterium]|nr:hypothetical protein [Rhodanobacteraceae bacterium]